MTIGQCIHEFSTSYGLPFSLFLAGLMGGFTHCVGMCSPFVMAQTKNHVSLGRLRSVLLLPYHMGRMTTYVVMAVLINSLINIAFVFSDMKTLVAVPMLVLAAVIFMVSAFPRLASLFPWAADIKMGVPYRFIAKTSEKLMKAQGIFGRYILGMLLGFMPCGMVVSALLASASAQDALHAGFSMAAFAIGTMPALILVSVGGSTLKHKYPALANRASQGAMVLSSLWLLALAGIMILE